MRHKTFLLLAVLLALPLSGCGSSAAEKPVTAELYAMDTVMSLTAYGSSASAALDASTAEIQRLEELLSRTKTDSEISGLNQAHGAPTAVDGEVAGLIQAALGYSAATDGTFDITVAPVVSAWGFTTDTYQVPAQSTLDRLLPLVDYTQVLVAGDTVTLGSEQSIDLGGIAKGYASDMVAGIFQQNHVASGMIYLGGNVYVRGTKPDGSAWRVAVQDPQDSANYAGILSLSDAFAVTSGGYQRYFEADGVRYHHIIDPSTGYPANNGLLSVTIVADANAQEGSPQGSGTMCDALSTALFVMGEERAEAFWRSGVYDFDMVLVTDDNRVLLTDGISSQFSQMEDSPYAYEVIR